MTAVRKFDDFMTVAEFLAWDAPDDGIWQLVDGVPQAMAPANGTHSVIQGEVGALIRSRLAAHRPGCRVPANPGVSPRLDSEDNFRISDLGVTCRPVRRAVVEVPEPILLIEILSPGNPGQTWTNVRCYPTIPSVEEILVIRTASIGVQVLRRGADGSWPDVPESIEAGDIELKSIGFRTQIEALCAGTWLAEQA